MRLTRRLVNYSRKLPSVLLAKLGVNVIPARQTQANDLTSTRKTAIQANPDQSRLPTLSQWRDTGEVYYLENTVKLSYQSSVGRVTIDKVALRDLPCVISRLQSEPEHSPIAQQQTANQTAAFNISVCAVTWQTNGESLRVKAIPDAALLRSQTACFTHAQAVFRHTMLLEHDDLHTPLSNVDGAGAFTFNKVSIGLFAQKISEANAMISSKNLRLIGVRPENFDSTFTDHETEQLDRLMGSGEKHETHVKLIS